MAKPASTRTGARGKRGRGSRALLVTGPLVLVILALFVYGFLQQQARERALAAALEGVERYPVRNVQHVPEGTAIEYDSDPPTGGPHYGSTAEPDFYTRPVDPGLLVHNLEHGHIVIYYDPERTPEDALDYVKELVRRYRGAWDAVLAVPRQDERYVLILTAWEHMLRLEAFDRERIDAFVDRFRGRGPENPVR